MPIWFGARRAKSLAPMTLKSRTTRGIIEEAARQLRAGHLVAFPTETVYGLGANALDTKAVRKIFRAKGRPLSSPLIVHVTGIAMARRLAAKWPASAEKLARQFWPGPLTIVVPKQSVVPDLVTAGLPSVGLRVPAHRMARQLLRAAGVPLAAPSANRFTAVSPTTAEHVRNAFPKLMVLEGGPCSVGIESTVISFAGDRPKILRPGMVTRKQIEEVIGPVAEGEGAESPGQHKRHYSPKTRIVLGPEPKRGHGVRLELGPEAADAAENLYATLHALDSMGYDWIAVAMPPATADWAGVSDRLTRAAGRASGRVRRG